MKLLHLYHDIMNLYGEYANILAMRDMVLKSGNDCVVETKTFGDSVDFSEYDFVYIGSGTERNMKLVLADFRRHQAAFETYVSDGKVALFTGNAFEMLGKTITDCNGTSYEGIGMFDFTVTEQNKTRDTSDAVFTADFLDAPLVGFVNKCSEIHGVNEPLFGVKMGLGNAGDDKGEGVRQNNLFGTHLTGPVLMKNPHFLSYLTELVTGVSPAVNPLQQQGFEITLRELTNRMNNSK